MENQKKKLRLDELKVSSFVTSTNEDVNTILGGTSRALTWSPNSITFPGVLGALCDLIINPPEFGGSDTPDCRSARMRAHCDTVLESIVVLPGGTGSGIREHDLPKVELPSGPVSWVGNALCK